MVLTSPLPAAHTFLKWVKVRVSSEWGGFRNGGDSPFWGTRLAYKVPPARNRRSQLRLGSLKSGCGDLALGLVADPVLAGWRPCQQWTPRPTPASVSQSSAWSRESFRLCCRLPEGLSLCLRCWILVGPGRHPRPQESFRLRRRLPEGLSLRLCYRLPVGPSIHPGLQRASAFAASFQRVPAFVFAAGFQGVLACVALTVGLLRA